MPPPTPLTTTSVGPRLPAIGSKQLRPCPTSAGWPQGSALAGADPGATVAGPDAAGLTAATAGLVSFRVGVAGAAAVGAGVGVETTAALGTVIGDGALAPVFKASSARDRLPSGSWPRSFMSASSWSRPSASTRRSSAS